MILEKLYKKISRIVSPSCPSQVISYQKSGRTWLRLMMGKVFQEHFNLSIEQAADVLDVGKMHQLDPKIPPLIFSHDGQALFQKTSELETDKGQYKETKIILLCRDPRDVVLSAWFRREKYKSWVENKEQLQTLDAFLRHEICGIEKIIAFLNIWAANRKVPKEFLLVRYEDMKEDTAREIMRILEFLAIEGVARQVIHDAVEFCSFENMQRMERENSLNSPLLKPINKDNPDSFKIRKGKVGGYKDYFSEQDVEYVDHAVATQLDSFYGYAP